MNNKLNSILNDFMKNADSENEEDLEKSLQEFIKNYNEGNIDYENSILDEAYEMLEEAKNSRSKKQAKKMAEKAYLTCPDCLDALVFQTSLEDDIFKRDELLDEGLEYEKERLEMEGYFSKDNFGHFYGLFETRQYIRGLAAKCFNYYNDGKLNKAKMLAMEIIKLNNSDNLGIRYLLMAILAQLEEEKEIIKLFKKYNEENLEMLIPLFVLYYKMEDDKKSLEILKKINNINSNFIKFFKNNIKEVDETPYGYYSRGGVSEVFMYIESYSPLFFGVPNIEKYIIKISKQISKSSK